MRNAILIGFVVFLVVVAGAFGLTWMSQASIAKRTVAERIEELNTKYPTISYESITASGFPKTLSVSVNKPHFAGLIPPEFRKSLPSISPAAKIDTTLNGAITFTASIFSNNFSVILSGDTQTTTDMYGKPISVVSKASGASMCVAKLNYAQTNLSHMWDFGIFSDDTLRMFRQLAMLDCVTPGVEYYNSATNEKLASYAPSRAYISNDREGSNITTRVYAKIVDGEVLPAMDTFLTGTPFASGYSRYGKQNAEIDIIYNGPNDESDNPSQRMPFEFSINNLAISNAAYSLTSNTHIKQTREDAQNAISFTTKTEYNAQEGSDALLRSAVQGLVASLYDATNANYAKYKPITDKYSVQQLTAIMLPVVPNVQSLGKMTLAADGKYVGDDRFTSGTITVNSLELSSSLYGLLAKGEASKTSIQPLPNAQIQLVCTNCLRLVDDMTGYTERLHGASLLLAPERSDNLVIKSEEVFGFKKFLTELAVRDEKTPDNFAFSIIVNGLAGFTINGKDAQAVLEAFNRNTKPAKRK